jgi:hypothetical protein
MQDKKIHRIIEHIECELQIVKLLADRKDYNKIAEFTDKIQGDMDELIDFILYRENKQFLAVKRFWTIFQKL